MLASVSLAVIKLLKVLVRFTAPDEIEKKEWKHTCIAIVGAEVEDLVNQIKYEGTHLTWYQHMQQLVVEKSPSKTKNRVEGEWVV